MPSPNQIEKEMDHIFFKLFELDPEDEAKSIFTIILTIKLSKNKVGTMVLFPCEELRKIKAQAGKKAANLPSYLFGEKNRFSYT